MLTNDFFYNLPDELIAQYPTDQRDASRLLYIGKENVIDDGSFCDISSYLRKGDLLVLNDTRVISARLFARKETGGKVEIMLERILDEKLLLVQLRFNKPPKLESKLIVDNSITFEVLECRGDMYLLQYKGNGSVADIFDLHGSIPLPPYIKRDVSVKDLERYQTVFSKNKGAVAAPTAGLHFTDQVLNNLQKVGIDNVKLTLHVGSGTFKPVRVNNISEHKMHNEYMQLRKEVADKINLVKKKGGRIIAVGTTVIRALETAASAREVSCYEGDTDIFIYPGFKFNIADMLLTNFHLPESTLLMLVCAFAGKDNIMGAYQHAIDRKYRFYSYGDAMLIAGNS